MEYKVIACVEPGERCWQVLHAEQPDVLLWVEGIILEELALHARQMQGFIERSIREKIDAVRAHLTVRETTMLRFVLEGMSTKEIAAATNLSERSVKLHLGRLFAKLDTQ